MRSLLRALSGGKILVSDGAWGTLLYQRGLPTGECPELWNVTHRDDVLIIAKSYIDAGADMILTNSFGGSPARLDHYGLKSRAPELNEAAAVISREAAGDNHFVLGSIGPSGVMVMMGQVSEDELYEGFLIQAAALKKGGVDALCIETMSAIDEACLAIRAVREATGLEVVCTFTFDKTASGEYRTMMGVSPAEMVYAVKEAGASIIGANCGNGFDQMIDIVSEIREVDRSTPVLVHANAGMPVFHDGEAVYPETAEMMASKVRRLIQSGTNIIGGCCGTTPSHIRAMADEIRKHE
jgi:5-methyltetrahydrofolate--homocysteine methyltransferase